MPGKITHYLNNKPKGKFGAHEYNMQDFGLSEVMLDEQYKRYTEYYKIDSEK